MIWIDAVEISECGINPTIKLSSACGPNDGSLVDCVLEVMDDHLDSSHMTLLGRVVEPCDLAHCEGNVRASVCGQVEKHSDDRWVAPLLIHGFTIRINSKCSGSGRNPVWVAIFH